MAETLKKHGEMLKFLSAMKPATAKTIVKAVSPEFIRVLCECCHNVLKGNVPLTANQKRKLCRHKNKLRSLTQKKLSIKRRKQILQQGGFLGALIGPIVGVLKSVLGF